MPVFSVPILQLPAGCVLAAPKTVPVVYDEEEVATAKRRDGNYDFLLFQGHLATGLTQGTLLLLPRYKDETDADGVMTRTYLAVEIVREEHFDIHRTQG